MSRAFDVESRLSVELDISSMSPDRLISKATCFQLHPILFAIPPISLSSSSMKFFKRKTVKDRPNKQLTRT